MVGRVDVNKIVPTAPSGTSDNRAASTQFVANAVAGIANVRTRISTATTFFINPASGNNSSSGTSSGAAWLDMTPLATNYDVQATITLQWVSGTTYTDKAFFAQSIVGNGAVILQGDTVTPSNVTLNAATSLPGGALFNFNAVNGIWTVQGFKLEATLSGVIGIFAQRSAVQYLNMEFAAMASGIHVAGSVQAKTDAVGPCTISGGGASHLDIEDGSVGHISVAAATMTLTGTPAFTQVLFCHGAGAVIGTTAKNWTGAASTATLQWTASLMSLIDTAAGTASIPGGTPGQPVPGTMMTTGPLAGSFVF